MAQQPPQHILDRALSAWNLPVPNGTPYKFSFEGTEGLLFLEHWCYQCAHDDIDKGKLCPFLNKAVFSGDAPNEWIYWNHKPICTAFESKK